MSKKKGFKNPISQDFTLNDSANAPKPVGRVKKSTAVDPVVPELSWDQIADDDLDIVEEINEDGTKNFLYKKKRHRCKSVEDNIHDRPGIVYPEIVWYLISKFIEPEQIGSFAGVNKACYDLTNRESFWRALYNRHCRDNPKLPARLRLENGYKVYGLRQRVIRALYHTYDVFTEKVSAQAAHDSQPHTLVKRRCVNVWYRKGTSDWSVYFKFKKSYPYQKIENSQQPDFIEELGRIEANPEEDSQVLQVKCKSFYEVPPLMGMTLSTVSVVLSQGFRYHRLHLGFNTGSHNISKDILPECSVVLDTVVNIFVFDWWHPKYPHFDTTLPTSFRDEESLPVLKKDFFSYKVDL